MTQDVLCAFIRHSSLPTPSSAEIWVSGQERRRAVTKLCGAIILGSGATNKSGFDATSLPIFADAVFAGAVLSSGGTDLASNNRNSHARGYRVRSSDHRDH